MSQGNGTNKDNLPSFGGCNEKWWGRGERKQRKNTGNRKFYEAFSCWEILVTDLLFTFCIFGLRLIGWMFWKYAKFTLHCWWEYKVMLPAGETVWTFFTKPTAHYSRNWIDIYYGNYQTNRSKSELLNILISLPIWTQNAESFWLYFQELPFIYRTL